MAEILLISKNTFHFPTDAERKQYIQKKYDQIITGILEQDALASNIDFDESNIV